VPLLRGADLKSALFEYAIFSNAHLEGADLKRANLEYAAFSNDHLEGAM
jgi:uncharacterized protein YjbI with pentapeptide repeats